MDNSQSSDVFSESVDMFLDSPANMDKDMYESFMDNTKSRLSMRCSNDKKAFPKYFATLLDDCDKSISKSLDFTIDLLSERNVQFETLIHYLSNVIELLQMLSDYIKNLVESMALACHNLKTFPTTTGRILIIVFTHCKDSDMIYGNYLGTVEKQLKDLFRMCHELQLTYLMVLEKHFVFDFTEKDEHNIFLQALEIILEIGEVVHKLDVKTMAEQWKAFTAICEKYSTHLCDSNIFYNSTEILCGMIKNNLKYAEEMHQDEKVLVRSIKVTTFTIKILTKICTIFKHATKKYKHILDLLIFTFLNGAPYLELIGKSTNFITLMEANVKGPIDCLLKELLLDEKFIHCLIDYDVSEIRNKADLLGFILLIATTVKIGIRMNVENENSKVKTELVQCIFRILPHCHIWFNLGLKFKEPHTAENKTFGLNEYLLTNTGALVATMDNKGYSLVEECMTNAILSTDCMSAMFSANLWTLLSRFGSRELLETQIISLCNFYKQLESHIAFRNSPQKLHLMFTINKLFQSMTREDKIKLFKMLPLTDNMSIWSVLRSNDLPEEMQRAKENILKGRTGLSNLSENSITCYEDVRNLINHVHLASSLKLSNNYLLEDTVRLWLKLCPEDNTILADSLEAGTLWCINIMEALGSLTSSAADDLCNRNQDLVKVLHVIAKLTLVNCLELKLVLLNLLCKICTSKMYDGNDTIECILIESFKNLIQNNESMVINKFVSILYENIDQFNFNKIISKAIDHLVLKQTWVEIKKNGISKKNYLEQKRILESASQFEFSHKCTNVLDIIDDADISKDRPSSNFDLVDLNNLFDSESDTAEPQCKKAKLLINEIDNIIVRLKEDVSKLCKVKENITCEDKLKIKELCGRLQNIVD